VLLVAWVHRPAPRHPATHGDAPELALWARLGRLGHSVRVPRLWARALGRRRARDALLDELPDVIDLLLLAVGSGLNVHLAIAAVSARSPPTIGRALREARRRAERGVALADALDDAVSDAGEGLRPLVVVLTSSLRYGTPIAPALERVAADARADRRRRAEEAARRVPVKLLFPLVACILPAFAALTVLPLLAGTLGSLRL
jgi:tight adherence protein C